MKFNRMPFLLSVLLLVFAFSQSIVAAEKLRLDLQTAILIGSTNSVLLKTLDGKRDALKMMITERWREFLPKVGIQYFGLRNINVNAQDTVYNDVRLVIQQLLFDGESALQIESAKLNQVLNDFDFRISNAKLRSEITKSYLKALTTNGKIFLAQKSLLRSEDILEMAKTEFRHGFANRLSVLEAESKLRQLELSVKKVESEHNQALYELKQFLNLESEVVIEMKETLFLDFVINP
ncbi:MAG: TolC family protein, partial [Leptospira sp.]|nr:TolC family protein [Leptospira sp.]